MYKFICNNNNYQDFRIIKTNDFLDVNIPDDQINITKSKLFSNDTFNFENNSTQIVHSHVRSCENIPGVISLSISFGKYKDKMLYLCKPDDKRIPYFLVPYKIPYRFDKSIKKLYITFRYVNWNDERPRGSMMQNFGNIEEVSNFYEYALYCKSLNISIQSFTKYARKKIAEKSDRDIIDVITTTYDIKRIPKKDEFIFTIDSSATNDKDDAFSYNFKENKITIYITNVALIMDYLDLWDSFTNRISTIYLPDKKRTMIPQILTDTLLSLNEGSNRLCYALEIFYDENSNIVDESVFICNVHISKNYSYDNLDLYKNKYYQRISEILKIDESQAIVSSLMIHFNRTIARYLSVTKIGIFRQYQDITPYKCEENENISKIPQNIISQISNFKTNASQYCVGCDEYDDNTYMQVSSPIRRLVDVINNIALLKYVFNDDIVMGKKIKKSNLFYNHWTSVDKVEYINISSRSIRKVQCKCNIFSQYMYNKENNITQKYYGYVFDKIKKHDGKFQYMVYLQKLKLTTYITILEDIPNYTCHLFELFVFMNQERDKNKIKLQICYISMNNDLI